MKEQFVTYEIAKRLRELGFNDKCFTYYGFNTELKMRSEFGWFVNNAMSGKQATALLWQQAINWLRDKHNLFVEFDWMQDQFWFTIYDLSQPLPRKTGLRTKYACNENDGWNTYEQAREAAILRALDIISNPRK